MKKMFENFVPVEYRGVSILSLFIFAVIFAGARAYFWWDKKEHARINARIDKHAVIADDKIKTVDEKVDTLFDKADEANRDISYIKSHVASIHESVAWIKDALKNK